MELHRYWHNTLWPCWFWKIEDNIITPNSVFHCFLYGVAAGLWKIIKKKLISLDSCYRHVIYTYNAGVSHLCTVRLLGLHPVEKSLGWCVPFVHCALVGTSSCGEIIGQLKVPKYLYPVALQWVQRNGTDIYALSVVGQFCALLASFFALDEAKSRRLLVGSSVT